MSVTRREFLAGSGATGALGVGAMGTLSGCVAPPRDRVAVECPAEAPEAVDARIGFVGDVMLGRGVNDRWREGPADGVWGATDTADGVGVGTPPIEYLQSLDGLLLNLECCVSDRGRRRPGRTYYFRAEPEWAVPALQAAGTSCVSLANNHVLDYGPTALSDTLAHLSEGGIAHAGAGLDREAATRPAIVEVGGVRIAVLAFTDQSPSYAAAGNVPGTAYAPLEGSYPGRRLVAESIERARRHDPDLLVATLHWGPNWVTTPSEGQQAFARWLIERGVDVVHGHSAHVVQGVEVHRGRPIVYDAGDFVDDYAIKEDLHNDRSFCFELRIADGRLEALRLVPVEIEDAAVRRAGDEAARWLRRRVRSLSEPFETTIHRDGPGLRIPLTGC